MGEENEKKGITSQLDISLTLQHTTYDIHSCQYFNILCSLYCSIFNTLTKREYVMTCIISETWHSFQIHIFIAKNEITSCC